MIEPSDLVIDNFAGGGGSSTGIERAIGRPLDYAINHDPAALAMHRANHPDTEHLVQNIWQVDPRALAGRRRVGLAWFSPDCKHHSKAKGGQPKERHIRDMAWVVVHWAKLVRPTVIMVENVEEFRDWGPLDLQGQAIRERRGETFRKWVRALRREGYAVAWQELRACDYGAPTIRKRLYIVARRDGLPIVWPAPTHGPRSGGAERAGADGAGEGERPPRRYRTAAQIIDWSLPCPSIFLTKEECKALGIRAKRPLADATMRRIAQGVVRYVLRDPNPFIVSVAHGDSGGRRAYPIEEPLGVQTSGGSGHALVCPVITGCGGRAAQTAPRSADRPLNTMTAKADQVVVAPSLVRTDMQKSNAACSFTARSPLTTITTAAGHAVVSAFLAQHNTGVVARSADRPLSSLTTTGSHQNVVAAHLINLKGRNRGDRGVDEPAMTICAGATHAGLVTAFLTKFYGADWQQQRPDEPLHTDTPKPRFALVRASILGQPYVIADIGMRMLTPRERFRAQGFPDSYIIDPAHDGKRLTQEQQGRMCGNSVCPDVAEALVAANCCRPSHEPPRQAPIRPRP